MVPTAGGEAAGQAGRFQAKNIYCLYSIEHCAKNSKHIFPEMKLCGLVLNLYIHVSVSYLCIPTISPRQTILGISHRYVHECGNWETEHYNFVLEITRPFSFISGNT